ncbi:phosphopantetheine-binding protein [Sphaerisporangium sp. TRM90804]|uniref:phosphopantetheine-binding protein n=1 Tax=Sphaerisporangium sp. TRM90804 TaxID=3031113 RepID=UPI002447AF21|nr:phosphopantetheine-binding protein [Sphaerisporangium sp. TRM90804]MDH2424482.1 phosphopantetheine-binding protein [Sphaerisporangium sp. TRM90804]
MSTGDIAGLGVEAIEAKVTEIWRDVLGVNAGEEEDTFFELNGESIAANRLASRVEAEFGVTVEVGDIFEDDPNLASFIGTVVSKLESASKV